MAPTRLQAGHYCRWELPCRQPALGALQLRGEAVLGALGRDYGGVQGAHSQESAPWLLYPSIERPCCTTPPLPSPLDVDSQEGGDYAFRMNDDTSFPPQVSCRR